MLQRLSNLAYLALSDVQNEKQGAGHADEHAEAEVCQLVLSENHACRADQSGEEHSEAEGVGGVEIEDERESHDGTNHAARGRSVRAYFQPRIDEGAHDLYGQGTSHDAQCEAGHAHVVHHIKECGVRRDGEDVRHDAPFPSAKLVARPSVDFSVGVDGQFGQDDGEESYHADDLRVVLPRGVAHIAEEEQHDEGHDWQIEWREHHGDDLRRQYEISVGHRML